MKDHKAHLEEVFSRLASRGHSLKPKKVKLLQEEVEYLGHISTPEGIKITPGQRDAIIKMPYPLDSEGEVEETRLRSFIGLANFSRRYINNFAMHAYRLNGLLRKDDPGIWTLAHAISYDAIKYDIAWSKGLYQIDYKLPIFVCTDACKEGIGGYIYQKLPGSDDERVVLYYSRSTADAEKQWDTRELELLAAIATMEQFHYYLDGQRFTLETDHNNLRWIMNIKNPQGRLARWITRLTAFDVEFVYRKGECNEVADCVSRNSLAARLAKIGVIKHDGAHSGLNSAARAQTLSRIRDRKKAELGEQATQHHAEFKQLSTQAKGDVGLFEVTFHRTVVRPEEEEVEIGENEKEGDRYSQCPPCNEKAEIKRALRWSSEPLDVPAEQRAVNLSREAIRRAQDSDEICKLIKKELEGETIGNLQLSRGYVMEEGVICKVSGEGDKEVTRPLAPRALRTFIMRNYHSSIWACHRGQHATNDEISKRFFWPKMREDINNFVSTCKVCQMAKALKPSNVGWLRGRRHSQAMNELCIDLIGPIGGSTNRHVKHAKPLHILVALDPFTHMVWLEPLFSKGGEEVMAAFVKRILLEEGAPRIIRCDNGSEFKNKTMNELRLLMRSELQFSPAYWPQSNQCERTNRQVGEILRCMTNTKTAEKQDWYKYIKHVEFAMRSSPISGTHITPFEAARGRLPRLVIDNPLLDSELPESLPMEEHVAEVKKMMDTAERELYRAKEKYRADNTERENAKRRDEHYLVGEKVLFYNRLVGDEQDPSKLKLRTSLYEVKDVKGDIYTLKLCESPDVERRAHVGQLIRFRGGDVQDFDAVHSESDAQYASDAAAAKQVYEKMCDGRFSVFVIKGESPSNLRVAEVLKKNEDLVKVWYYVDKTVRNYDNAELTPGLRRLVPEWYDEGTGQVNLRPTPRELGRGNLKKRTDSFAKGDIEVVIASFAMHSDGKIPDVQVEKIEKWLRVRSKSDERALRALPGKVVSSRRTDPSRSRSRPAHPEVERSLWESAIRLRSVSGN
jgi:hypothetical protein